MSIFMHSNKAKILKAIIIGISFASCLDFNSQECFAEEFGKNGNSLETGSADVNNEVDKLYDRASYLLKYRNYDGAKELINEYISKNPINTNAYLIRGQAEYFLGEKDKALEDLSFVLLKDIYNVDALLYRSYIYRYNGSYDRAASDLEKLLRIDENNSEANKLYGDILYYKKAFDKSIEHYEKAIKVNQNIEHVYENLEKAKRALVASRGGLDILSVMSHDELNVIVKPMLEKYSEDLSQKEDFKNDYTKYHREIGEELRKFGGHSFLNLYRGEGVSYDKLLRDVCDYLDVSYQKDMYTSDVENALLKYIEIEARKKMTEEEKSELRKRMEEAAKNIPTGTGAVVAYDVAAVSLAAGGLYSYVWALSLANSISSMVLGHTISLTAGLGVLHGVSILTGPIGLAVNGVFMAATLASASYKITVPAVIYIASMRQAYINCPIL